MAQTRKREGVVKHKLLICVERGTDRLQLLITIRKEEGSRFRVHGAEFADGALHRLSSCLGAQADLE